MNRTRRVVSPGYTVTEHDSLNSSCVQTGSVVGLLNRDSAVIEFIYTLYSHLPYSKAQVTALADRDNFYTGCVRHLLPDLVARPGRKPVALRQRKTEPVAKAEACFGSNGAQPSGKGG